MALRSLSRVTWSSCSPRSSNSLCGRLATARTLSQRLAQYRRAFARDQGNASSCSEQEAIVRFIRKETQGLIAAISRLEREIELLREYRTRLVADVVTGKLDVREAAARLPDEAPLDTVEDDADLGDETEAADEEAAV